VIKKKIDKEIDPYIQDVEKDIVESFKRFCDDKNI
jgi:hypothetical protein